MSRKLPPISVGPNTSWVAEYAELVGMNVTEVCVCANQVIDDEGCKYEVYRCTGGKRTIGVGRNVDDKGFTVSELAAMFAQDAEQVCKYGIGTADAMMLFRNDLVDATRDAMSLVGRDRFALLSAPRKAVIVNMAFNMGRSRLGKFRLMLNALKGQAFHAAAWEMQDSRWYRQVGRRAERLRIQMATGEWCGIGG